MDHWIINVLEQLGAIGVGVLMLMENVFPPIPSELVMPWAGYSVSQGEMSFVAAVTAGSIGSFAGALLWYFVARWIGKARLAHWIDGYGAWLTITPADLDRLDDWFESWGAIAVLICRLVPGIRTLISIPADFSEMPMKRFSLYTAIGTVIWTAVLVLIGWWLGDNYEQLAGPLGWVSTAVIVGMFGWWVWRLHAQQSMRKKSKSMRHSK
ncbi:DedA family protein [Novipirellula rosea]|uniref:DedA family protein n=1 Tax=Novipirellula rosea TaxID=1031540 RepID=A0ABP8NMV4_9BACT